MEKQLREIEEAFQSGKHDQAITELRSLIEASAIDDQNYRAYDLLGGYLNDMGKHVEAVDAWTNALKLLENTPGGVDNLNKEKLIDWMDISLKLQAIQTSISEIMEKQLGKIQSTFQSGKHNQAITELRTLIETSAKEDRIYKAYDLLGDYLNYMGKHVEAVDVWTNALELLENTPGGIDNLNEQKLIDWMNISLTTAKVLYRLGRDGPGVSHKYNKVCYCIPKMSESEKAEWTKTQFEMTIKHYRAVIEKIPENHLETERREIQMALAQALFNVENFDEAVKIYEDAFNNDGDAVWLYKAADCSWQQGKKEEAYTRLQQLIATEPTFAMAYKLCATYFTEKNDITQADEYMRQYKFYSWIPEFCRHIKYNSENLFILDTLKSDKALECVETTLTTDTSKRSTEFLAAICYHHYHGPVENKAFKELERRGIAFEEDEKDFIGSTLMYLIKNHQSICTIKGAADALAGMKYEQTFEVLANLLPQDLNLLYPMHIPRALAKLDDPRAILLLIKIIEEPIVVENDDSDSSDEGFASGGTGRLVVESYKALSDLIGDRKGNDLLSDEVNDEAPDDEVNDEETREVSPAAVGVSAELQEFLDQVETMLVEGKTLHNMIVKYLKKRIGQSPQIEKILLLNEEIHNKEKENSNNDD